MEKHNKKIVAANTPSCKTCKKTKGSSSRLLFDDYDEELNEYAMDAPGSYQGASVWAGTGNYGFGGIKQISGQKLNKATQKISDLEAEFEKADQRDDDNFEDEYAEIELEKMKDKFEKYGVQPVQNEAYGIQQAAPSGRSNTFANLPGYPRPNSLVKKMDFIPDDQTASLEAGMEKREEEWLDHLAQQPMGYDKATVEKNKLLKNRIPQTPTIKRNNYTPSNGLGYGAIANAKQYVPKELDQYSDNSEDILWTIGKRNT